MISFLLGHFHVFGSTWYLSVHLVELSYHPLLVSLILSGWKTFPKSHPRKFLIFFYFLLWFKQSPSRQSDKVFETSNRKYLLQFIKRRSTVHQKKMPPQNTLKSNQSIIFSQNYTQIRLSLWLVDNITENSCSFQLFPQFILKRGTFPPQNMHSNLKITYQNFLQNILYLLLQH